MKANFEAWGFGVMTLAGVLGCDAGGTSDKFDRQPPQVEPTTTTTTGTVPDEPEQRMAVTAVTPLDALLADQTLVGVTIEPTGAARFVLTEESGLYAIADGEATLVFDTTNLPPSEFVPELPFTDVVALSNKRFALTAKNEGYLLDTEDQSLTRFFCYLPNESPDTTTGNTGTTTQSISEVLAQQGIDVYQITQAVTHNAAMGMLFAYPITVGSADGVIYGAEVGVFSDVTGEPMQWSLVQGGDLATVGATGMIADDFGFLTLALGAQLYSYDGVSNPSLIESLEPYGVGEISGLTAVPGTDHILVLDGQHRQLVELAPKI